MNSWSSKDAWRPDIGSFRSLCSIIPPYTWIHNSIITIACGSGGRHNVEEADCVPDKLSTSFIRLRCNFLRIFQCTAQHFLLLQETEKLNKTFPSSQFVAFFLIKFGYDSRYLIFRLPKYFDFQRHKLSSLARSPLSPINYSEKLWLFILEEFFVQKATSVDADKKAVGERSQMSSIVFELIN